MSGAWSVVEKASAGGSAYKSFWNEMVVFMPSGKTTGFVLTPTVKEKLGNPTHVMVLHQGTKIGLMAADETNSNGYALTGTEKMGRVNCATFIKEHCPTFPYRVKFEANMDGDVVVFDTTQGEQA